MKQGSLGIVHFLTVFSPELEMDWVSLLDSFGSCAAQRVSGTGPQLFQTFTVHTSHITKVMLSAKHLVSGMSNSQVYFWGKYSNIPGKALFHDGDHVTFMAWFSVGHQSHILIYDIHSYIKYTSKSLVFFSSNPNWSIDYDHISFRLIRRGLSVTGAWIKES